MCLAWDGPWELREQDIGGTCAHGVYLVTKTGSQRNHSTKELVIIQRMTTKTEFYVLESQLVWGSQRALLRK